MGLHDLSRFSNRKGYRILEVTTEQETTMIERKEVKDAWMEDVLRVRAHLLLKLNRDGCQSLYHLLLCRHGRRRNLLRKRRQKERASLIKCLVIFDVFQETKNVSALFVPKY